MSPPIDECPECHESLKDIDPKKHAIRHWGKEPQLHKTISEEGLRRAKKLDPDFALKGGGK